MRVINLSANATQPASYLLSALRAAATAGISIVTPAGNQGLDASRPANYPALYNQSLTGQHEAIPGLIAVGSLKPGTAGAPPAPSNFSSLGAWVTLSAQGEGLQLASAADVNAFFQKTGTSFSTPAVSAAVALIRAKNPGFSPEDAKLRLTSSATPVAGCAAIQCGAGMLNIPGALTP